MWLYQEKKELLETVEKDAHRICWLIAEHALNNQDLTDEEEAQDAEFMGLVYKLNAYKAILEYVDMVSKYLD